MQIEILEKCILLHMDLRSEEPVWVDGVSSKIGAIYELPVVIVPNGYPTHGPVRLGASNLYMIEDNDISKGLLKKLVQNRRPGAIILLTKDEMSMVTDPTKFCVVPAPVTIGVK